MIRKIGLGLVALMLAAGCSGSDGANGKNGENGENGTDGQDGEGFETTASVSGVFPGFALLGASTEVTLSGFATNWDETTTVSFGDGVTVSNVRVASPTALIATVEVAGTASMGLRDVSVTTGDEALTYAQGFNLGSPIAVVTQGTVAQGSIVLATIKNMDPSRPFDDTFVQTSLFDGEYTNLAVTAPAGVIATVSNVSPFKADVTLLIDGDATAGATALEVVSGPDGGEQESFPHPEAVTIEARTPTAVSGDTDVTIPDAFASQFVSFEVPTGLQILDISTTAGAGDPAMAILGASQSFQDLQAFDSAFFGVSDASATSTWYGVVWDNTGESGYTASISAKALAATGATEGTSNGDKGSATALTLPAVVQGASLTDDLDADWFAITVAAGDVGKSIFVKTLAGDADTDTYVTVYDPSDSVFAEGDDLDYHETVLTPAITDAGTYYIAVEASTYASLIGHNYDLAVYLK